MKAARSIFAAIAIISFMIGPTVVIGQEKPIKGDWKLIEMLQPGDELDIRLKNGDRLNGTFNGLTATMLITQKGSALVETERINIRKVYRLGGKEFAKHTLRGLGIGTGIGLAIGGIVAAKDVFTETGERDTPWVVGVTLGAIIGTATGALIGSKRKKRSLIYETI